MPPQFHEAVRAVAAPGTTILVTQARVIEDTTPTAVPLAAETLGLDGALPTQAPIFDMER
jgi:hypothetical protein